MSKNLDNDKINRRQDWMRYNLLVSEHKRTGAGAVQLSRVSSNIPKSLSKERINNILNRRVVYFTKEEYDFLVWAFSQLPTVERIKITPQKISKLTALIDEKKISLTQVSKAMPRHLKIDRGMLRKWLAREIRSTRRECYEAVLEFLENYEPPPPKLRIYEEEPQPKLVPITQEFLDHLEAEIKRTGIAPSKLLRMLNEKRINAGTINGWRSGRIKMAHRENTLLLLKLYSGLMLPKKNLSGFIKRS